MRVTGGQPGAPRPVVGPWRLGLGLASSQQPGLGALELILADVALVLQQGKLTQLVHRAVSGCRSRPDVLPDAFLALLSPLPPLMHTVVLAQPHAQ